MDADEGETMVIAEKRRGTISTVIFLIYLINRDRKATFFIPVSFRKQINAMQYFKSIRFISGIIISCTLFLACSKSNDGGGSSQDCSGTTNKAFAADVNPLIQTFCNQSFCHSAGSTNGPGPLTNYSEIFNARVRIRGQVQAGLMPQNTTLTAAQKNSIICWIDAGAPNN